MKKLMIEFVMFMQQKDEHTLVHLHKKMAILKLLTINFLLVNYKVL